MSSNRVTCITKPFSEEALESYPEMKISLNVTEKSKIFY